MYKRKKMYMYNMIFVVVTFILIFAQCYAFIVLDGRRRRIHPRLEHKTHTIINNIIIKLIAGSLIIIIIYTMVDFFFWIASERKNNTY